MKTIDEYIASQPETVRPVLERVREILRRALPEADEVISYGMGAFKMHGRIVLYFAGWKEHFSLYPATERSMEAIPELASRRVSKGTLRFELSEAVPVKLITRFARFRAAEVVEARQAKAAARKAAR